MSRYKTRTISEYSYTDPEFAKLIAKNARLLREDMPWLHALRKEWSLAHVNFVVVDLKKGEYNEPFERIMHQPANAVDEIWFVKEDEGGVEVYQVISPDSALTVAQALYHHKCFRVNEAINFIVAVHKELGSMEKVQIFRAPVVVYPNPVFEFEDRICVIAEPHKCTS